MEPGRDVEHVKMRFRSAVKSLGLTLGNAQIDALGVYVTRLLEWNKKVNLVSRADEGNIWFSHILHSVAVLSLYEVRRGARMLDIGAGGGLPSVPIAITRPDVSVVAIDSIRKKTVALSSIVASLGVPNIEVANTRVEAMATQQNWRQHFDIVIARAVAPLTDLIRWSTPLLCQNEDAVLLAMKGGDLESEIGEAKIKTRPRSIAIRVFAFDKGEDYGLVDKKLIIVTP